MIYETITQCRSCGSSSLEVILDLGRTPLADRILTKGELNGPEHIVPLTLVACQNCGLVQILETVDPEILFFSEYPYFSSISPTLRQHFADYASDILNRYPVDSDSLVVEIASNDGCLLENFSKAGVPVLGIDPAPAPVAKAREKGIPTECCFFTNEFAATLSDRGLAADVIMANNVLAHVRDLNGFVAGITHLLEEDGVAILEMPYLANLLEHCEFDTIYHQHLCYFSLGALVSLFRRHGLSINDVKQTNIHGGSIRIFAEKKERVGESVRKLLKEEEQQGSVSIPALRSFADRTLQLKKALLQMMSELSARGLRIAAYGAAAKATTLLSYCDLGLDDLEFVADLNPYKHGKYMGGSRLPIVSPEVIDEKEPDVLLILAWNFAEEIMKQLEGYRKGGGQFLVPVPEATLHPPLQS